MNLVVEPALVLSTPIHARDVADVYRDTKRLSFSPGGVSDVFCVVVFACFHEYRRQQGLSVRFAPHAHAMTCSSV